MALDLRGLTPLLQVYDMPSSLRFYRDLLGFEVVATSPNLGAKSSAMSSDDRFHWVWLRLGSAELMLNTAYEFDHERPARPDRARTAAHDDTGLYFGCPDVDGAYQELLAKGVIAKKPSITGYGMKQMYFHDPDGYSLCFQWSAQA